MLVGLQEQERMGGEGRGHTLAEYLGRYAIEFVLQLVEEFVHRGGEFRGACGGVCWCLHFGSITIHLKAWILPDI